MQPLLLQQLVQVHPHQVALHVEPALLLGGVGDHVHDQALEHVGRHAHRFEAAQPRRRPALVHAQLPQRFKRHRHEHLVDARYAHAIRLDTELQILDRNVVQEVLAGQVVEVLLRQRQVQAVDFHAPP